MCYVKKVFIFSSSLIFNLLLSTNVLAITPALYRIDFSPPADMQWKLVNNQEEVYRSLQTWLPQGPNQSNAQRITIDYEQGLKTTLKDAMQTIVNAMNNANCERQASTIIKQESNVLTFATIMYHCSNSKTSTNIYKIFEMPDGQYTINYYVEPDQVPLDIIKKMYAVIQSATISQSESDSAPHN